MVTFAEPGSTYHTGLRCFDSINNQQIVINSAKGLTVWHAAAAGHAHSTHSPLHPPPKTQPNDH